MRVKLQVVAWLILIPVTALFADQWYSPSPQGFYSANSQYFFETIPYGSSLGAWAIYSVSDPDSCVGSLFELSNDGEYHKVWSRKLVNEVFPCGVALTNDGKYVVTFDGWYGRGYESETVIIYGKDSRLIRQIGLNEIVPDSVVDQMIHTITMIFWGGFSNFDYEKEQLVLNIALWGEVRIDLSSGMILSREEGDVIEKADELKEE